MRAESPEGGPRPDQETLDTFAEASDLVERLVGDGCRDPGQAERLLADLEDCGPTPAPSR